MKQIFIFRKTYAAVILIGYLMAFSSAMAQQMPRRNALRETNNEFFKTEEARRLGQIRCWRFSVVPVVGRRISI